MGKTISKCMVFYIKCVYLINLFISLFSVCIFLGSLQLDYRWGPLLTKEYPIKYSLQGFLLKPSHGGFSNFFPLVPLQE